MKTIYLIRHCSASGQEPEAKLTEQGVAQSEKLAEFLVGEQIDEILSSPYVRAYQSVAPLAEKMGLDIKTDERLSERVLSANPDPNWLTMLEETFLNLDVSFDGGESSREAMARGISVVLEALECEQSTIAIVTHGNLLSLLLKYFEPEIGFDDWKSLTNPDVFKLTFNGDVSDVKRVWV